MSFTNYMIATLETEKIAHDSREIITKIEKSFAVDDLLEIINSKFKEKNPKNVTRQKIIGVYGELLKSNFRKIADLIFSKLAY